MYYNLNLRQVKQRGEISKIKTNIKPRAPNILKNCNRSNKLWLKYKSVLTKGPQGRVIIQQRAHGQTLFCALCTSLSVVRFRDKSVVRDGETGLRV